MIWSEPVISLWFKWCDSKSPWFTDSSFICHCVAFTTSLTERKSWCSSQLCDYTEPVYYIINKVRVQNYIQAILRLFLWEYQECYLWWVLYTWGIKLITYDHLVEHLASCANIWPSASEFIIYIVIHFIWLMTRKCGLVVNTINFIFE